MSESAFSEQLQEAERLIRASEFGAQAEALVKSLLPRIGLSSYPWMSAALPLGHSRFGGPVDLPAGVAWPTADGRPMPLLAQLNFGDLGIEGGMPAVDALPKTGWLCLFLDIDGFASGAVGEEPGLAVMQFEGAAEELIRHDEAAPDGAKVWTICHVATLWPADHNVCLPDAEAVDSALYEEDEEGGDELEDEDDEDDEDEELEEQHAELAWAIDDLKRMRTEVTLLGSPSLMNPDPRGSQDDPSEWMLLLQFDGECSWVAGCSDPSGYVDRPTLGSADYLQYFVRKQDFAAGRLDRGFFDWMMT